ncbi:alpha/beta fold hydrolase [Vibrio ziniensis]|uniref:Alpha/beta hydrolase n=1 Tax=Vibrio ziniensis TaxID=2711221 RepID=A0A6G7CJL9_9VIBR|nr:alpha/beta hydrolase [Vibrio ziniensis]QIH42305.1 alpha/beta hydrolase [Vibrio ziniensis]
MMFKQTQYPIHSGSVAAVEFGDSKAADISVVFIHGWLDNAASFHSVMRQLSKLAPQLHLCAIDLPGHGLSEHKNGSNFYPFHDYIDDFCQLMLNFSANKRVIVGHSLGALVASCYSAAFPENVAGLIQIEGYAPLAEPVTESVARIRQGVMSRQRLRKKPERGYDDVSQAIERRSMINHLAPELISPVVERGIKRVGDKWYWRHDVKLKSESLYRMSPQHAAEIMNAIRCPHWLILGDQGYQSLKGHRSISEQSCLETFTVSGGHHCHLEQPEQVAELIFGVVNKI